MTATDRPASQRATLRCAVAIVALAGSVAVGAQVRVEDAWVRASVPGQRTTGAFMTLVPAADTTLVGAASPRAGGVEIHEMKLDAGVMRMRPVARIPLTANTPFALKPGGHHVMLTGLQSALNAGERVPITLTFEDSAGRRTAVDLTATVRPLAGAPPKHAH